MIITKYISIDTNGDTDIIDITTECNEIVQSAGMKDGVITVFNPGSTGGLTTLEYETNLVQDLKEALEIVAPLEKEYKHGQTWHDDNGSAHIRSSFIGPSISVPFTNKELTLGTWQQVVFCDFDTRPRKRKLVVQVVGE